MLKTHSPGPTRFRPGLDQLDRLLARLHAVETQLLQPGLPGAEQVHVVVDQSRDDGLSPQVDPPGARPREPGHVLVGADGDDAVATDRHRLRDREALVDRDDFPVGQDQVRRGLLRTQERERARGEAQRGDGRGAQSQPIHGSVSCFDPDRYRFTSWTSSKYRLFSLQMYSSSSVSG